MVPVLVWAVPAKPEKVTICWPLVGWVKLTTGCAFASCRPAVAASVNMSIGSRLCFIESFFLRFFECFDLSNLLLSNKERRDLLTPLNRHWYVFNGTLSVTPDVGVPRTVSVA